MKTKILVCLASLLCFISVSHATIVLTNVARSAGVADSVLLAGFPATGAIDGLIGGEGTNQAPVSYWLGPSGNPSAYFILDLRGRYPIESVVLYNTHNRAFYDRGTASFSIYGGDALAREPPSSGFVDRYYSLDGTLNDATTNAAQGTFYDSLLNPVTPVYTTNVPPAVTNDTQSVSFSGGGEFLEILDTPNFSQPTAYSISLWARFQVIQACSLILRSANTEYSTWSHQLRLTGAGNFEAYTYDGAAKVVTGTTVVQPDTWYHVVVTAQNGGVERLYVNGVEEGTAAAIGALYSGGTKWRLGTGSGGGFIPMAGDLDEVGIWFGNPLSAALITRLKNGERPLTVTNTPTASTGFQIVNPVVIASGTLTNVTPGDPVILPQTFPLVSPITVRYVQFQAQSATLTNNHAGLNEIQLMARVDDTPPDVGLLTAVFLSWPHRPFPFILQNSPSLSPPVWTTITNPAPTLTGTNFGVFLLATNIANYYRLSSP